MTTITNVIQDSNGRVVEWRENNQTYRLDWNAAGKPISLKIKNSPQQENLVVFRYDSAGTLIEDRDNKMPSTLIDDLFDVASGAVAVFSPTLSNSLTRSQALAVPRMSYRRSGSTAVGVGADLVFSSAGGVGAGKLNTIEPLLIPGNTLVPGTSQIEFAFSVRKVGTDASFLSLKFGPTNGGSDGDTGAAIQFPVTNPSDTQFVGTLNVVTGAISLQGQSAIVNASSLGAFVPTTLSSLNFTVDNFLSLYISGATTGSYRNTGHSFKVFL